jgi:hypothetical protein
MKMDRLQGTKLDWYVKDTDMLKESTLKTFVVVARMEEIRLLLAYAFSNNIKVNQMETKSTFLNGELEEEVYIEDPEGFQLLENTDYVCKLKKTFHGLKNSPRAW